MLSLASLQAYRSQTFRTAPGMQLHSVEEAEEFVNQRGFVFFWPNKGIEFPSLWSAVAGDRPVADEHDDPGHITWGWKDDSLDKKRWYYGRVLKHRNAFISLGLLPYFYALSPNYGEPADDYLIQYQQGQLRPESKWVFEALLHEGPMDTISLRKAARLSSRESDGRFNAALDNLQMDFRITPIGVAPVGAWRYAFIYECTHRHFPDLFQRVLDLDLSEPLARRKITATYLQAIGAARLADVQKLFGWTSLQARRALEEIENSGEITGGVHVENNSGEWFVLTDLIHQTI
jgi:hypothetical protein